MHSNKLIIAAAGSGKTTHLVNRALENPSERVLITTYTEANEREIKSNIIRSRGYVPANVTIQTWFAFLLQHGVRPFQSALDESIHDKDIGFCLSSKKSGQKLNSDGNPLVWKRRPLYWGESNFREFYFTRSYRIYSDKISKFVCRCDGVTKGDVVSRIARVFDCVLVDEVQDLAGFDLEVLKLLLMSDAEVLLVGDPRQVTYLTHHSAKHAKYRNGRIRLFVEEQLGKNTQCAVDDTTLIRSHRNNQSICDLSNQLYPALPPSRPCECDGCRADAASHQGVFWITREELEEYIRRFGPVQLRWSSSTVCCSEAPVTNFGESKGMSFDRVVIYPTRDMRNWILDRNQVLKEATRAKLYVAITRARHSVAFLLEGSEASPVPDLYRFSLAGG
ncbi:UvrD-helicase domain-containing protein [Planctomycetota bacterium]